MVALKESPVLQYLREIAHLQNMIVQLQRENARLQRRFFGGLELISVAEAAQRAGVKPSTIYRHLKREVRKPRWRGKLIGTHWMVYTSGEECRGDVHGARGVGSTGQDGGTELGTIMPPPPTHEYDGITPTTES